MVFFEMELHCIWYTVSPYTESMGTIYSTILCKL